MCCTLYSARSVGRSVCSCCAAASFGLCLVRFRVRVRVDRCSHWVHWWGRLPGGAIDEFGGLFVLSRISPHVRIWPVFLHTPVVV